MKKIYLIGLLLLLSLVIPKVSNAQLVIAPSGYVGSGGVAPGPILFPDGSSAAPSITFASAPTNGLFYVGSNTIGYSSGGTKVFQVGATNVDIISDSAVLRLGSSQDVILARDAANTLAQRNGTNSQRFNLYQTYTDASNYSRLSFYYGSAFNILTEKAGTGIVRDIELQAGTGAGLYLGSNSTRFWNIPSTGHFLANTDNTLDIGASGATRPRTGYFGTSVDTPYLSLAGNKALRSGVTTVTGASSTCGTSAPAIVGNNSFGKVTTGSVAPTSCVVTFSSTWTTAPACLAANETTSNLLRATSTPTNLTLTGTMVAGDVLVYSCGGYVP